MTLAKVFLLFLVSCFFLGVVRAQSVQNSRVTGVVTDPSGASVGGAQVQMTQTETALVRTTASNEDGSFTLPDLPTGPYQLQVKKQGFQTYVQTGIVLEVGTSPTLNVSLQVGAVTQEVTVTANAAVVETHSSQLGQVVNQQEVLDIPLNARDPMQLLTLTPAAVLVQGTSFNGNYEFPAPYVTSFAGTNPGAGNFFLDGASMNNGTTNGVDPMPFPDALQEFNVTTSALPAQYGMHSSAAVNAITKSGSNGLHGDVFEFVRNGIFNARSFYAPIRDPLKRNQFGGVVGGPIKKDKVFFFAAAQETVVRESSNNVSIIPTAAEIAGNFQTAVTAGCFASLKAPFASNSISSFLSQPAVKLAKLFPATTSPCGTYSYQIKTDPHEPILVGKVDWHISDKHSIFVRYDYSYFYLPPDTSTILTLNQADQRSQYQGLNIGDTYIVSSSIVNSFHVNSNRTFSYKGFNPGFVSPTDLGVGGSFYNPVAKFGEYTVGSDFAMKTGAVPVTFNETDPSLGDDVEITRGQHRFGFGGEIAFFAQNNDSPIQVNGIFVWSGNITGNAMADFLLGDLSSFQQANLIYKYARKHYYGVYGQDSWQLSRKLTVNYGLRWEPFLPNYDRNGRMAFFSLPRYIAGTRSNVFPNAPPGLEYPAQGELDSFGTKLEGPISPGDYSGHVGAGYTGDLWHFEPRIGVSYDPRGLGREVIRASYGTFYDFESNQFWMYAPQQAPWSDLVALTGRDFSNPWGACRAGIGITCATYNATGTDPYPIAEGRAYQYNLPAGGYESTNDPSLGTNAKAPMLQQWNLSLQKQFASNWSVTATYMGNHGTHQWLAGEMNPGIYIPGTCTGTGVAGGTNGLFPGTSAPDGLAAGASGACTTSANVQLRRRLTLINPVTGPSLGLVGIQQDIGFSKFESGVLSVQKRMSDNFTATLNYTFGHCIDNGETSGIQAQDAWRYGTLQDVGNCSFDHRQQLTITGLYATGSTFHSGVTNAIFGNWQVAPLVTYLTGDSLSITTGTDTATLGISGGQYMQRIGNPSTPHTNLGGVIQGGAVVSGTLGVQWFNKAAFAVPTAPAGFAGNVVNNGTGPITVGPLSTNVGRTSMRGPALPGFDLSLTRKFKITERHEIDFRADAFNIFNLVRYTDPIGAANSPFFGESVAPSTTGTSNIGFGDPRDPRIMQFALKYLF